MDPHEPSDTGAAGRSPIPGPDNTAKAGQMAAPTSDSAALDVRALRKRFGRTVALDGIDLTVASGEVHGLLGPNGAGKSTTIRVLLGLLRADAGRAQVLGADPWANAVALHRRVAYVPGDVELWPNLTGGEAIDVLARLHGSGDRARRDDLCERFDLDIRKKGRTYSKGNRQKVALVAALSTRAELLILDEPTAGLDPLMEAVFQSCIRELVAEGRTVLLSSHILAQVEALADRISIVRQGRIVETGTLGDLRHLSRTSIAAITRAPVDGLAGLDGVHDVRLEGGQVRFDVDGEHLERAMGVLLAAGVTGLTVTPPTLEQVLLRHYGDTESVAS